MSVYACVCAVCMCIYVRNPIKLAWRKLKRCHCRFAHAFNCATSLSCFSAFPGIKLSAIKCRQCSCPDGAGGREECRVTTMPCRLSGNANILHKLQVSAGSRGRRRRNQRDQQQQQQQPSNIESINAVNFMPSTDKPETQTKMETEGNTRERGQQWVEAGKGKGGN